MAESGSEHGGPFIVFGCPSPALLLKPLGGCVLAFECLIESDRFLADRAECENATWVAFGDVSFGMKFKIANIHGFYS